jgi:hypothetical protein
MILKLAYGSKKKLFMTKFAIELGSLKLWGLGVGYGISGMYFG